MMSILVVGAGKSSTCLIQYLIQHATKYKWELVIADGCINAIEDKINGSNKAKAVVLDVTNRSERQRLIKAADLVVSLMPPHLHIHLAKDCLQFKKNLITSSYIAPEIKELDQAVKEAGLMFMCEMGLDPGIDHMTANHIIHSIQRVASTISSFRSYCGGLIAPESDDNPWHYKFSWNPKNIVTAGLGGAHYLNNGKEVTIPYEQLFENNKKIKVDDHGSFAYYPNRDSLTYLNTYEVPDVKTFLRATLRHPDFCKGWNAVIKLGLTDQNDNCENVGSYANWIKTKTAYNNGVSLQKHTANYLELAENDKVINMLEWLGLFDEMPVKTPVKTSADLLLKILLNKWEMKHSDKDMVVMQHDVEYVHKGRKIELSTNMVVKGDNSKHSAMAKTVGLPMGVLAKLVATNKISPPTGVRIPNMPAVYKPVMNELSHYGINFEERIS